jgi:hypothetical protein
MREDLCDLWAAGRAAPRFGPRVEGSRLRALTLSVPLAGNGPTSPAEATGFPLGKRAEV